MHLLIVFIYLTFQPLKCNKNKGYFGQTKTFGIKSEKQHKLPLGNVEHGIKHAHSTAWI